MTGITFNTHHATSAASSTDTPHQTAFAPAGPSGAPATHGVLAGLAPRGNSSAGRTFSPAESPDVSMEPANVAPSVTCSVAPQTCELLNKAQDAIDKVKELLPFGAGNNQRADASDQTKWNAALATAAAQQLNPHMTTFPKLGPLRATSLIAGAGNCQEQAAIAHSLLRESLSSEHRVAFASRRVSPGGNFDHHFVAAWHKDSPETRVIADPWPLQAQAVLQEHHFAHGSEVQLDRIKPGGAQAGTKLQSSAAKIGFHPQHGPVYGRGHQGARFDRDWALHRATELNKQGQLNVGPPSYVHHSATPGGPVAYVPQGQGDVVDHPMLDDDAMDVDG
jgi:hypothetical protein